jgi:hypothetical protein
MHYHHRKLIILGLLLFTSAVIFAQKIAKAKNVELGIQQNKALIHYEIKSSGKGSGHSVHLKFLDKQYSLITPNTLSGDVGPNISNGINKTIEWDITNDFQLLSSAIRPVLFVDGVSKEFNSTGGPGNALFSVLMPGLGDYFVADHRLMHFKPYLRTISSLGLIGLGIYAGNQRYHDEGQYITVLAVRYIPGASSPERYKEIYEEGDLQYWLFKGDRELFISLGAAIWLADIVWVLAKGTNNKNFIKELQRQSDVSLGYGKGKFNLKYSRTF